MRLPPSFVTSLLAVACAAQNVYVGHPENGARVSAGNALTIEVDKPNSLTGSTEVSLIIALRSCPDPVPCFKPTEVLGTVLYAGPWNPQYQGGAGWWKPPHQNFTFTLPQSTPKGKAQLNVGHLTLLGAGPFPYLQFDNITVTVV